jgi:hypothetical protein
LVANGTPVSDVKPLVDNEMFRLGDRVEVSMTGLATDDCGDLATLSGREVDVLTDIECP